MKKETALLKESTLLEDIEESNKKSLPQYVTPKVITYCGDELMAELGPAQACNPFNNTLVSC